MALLGAFAWAIFAVIVAASARRKGFSYGWYLFMSIVGGPVQAVITLAVAIDIAQRR